MILETLILINIFIYCFGVSFFAGFILSDEISRVNTNYISIIFAFGWPVFPVLIYYWKVE